MNTILVFYACSCFVFNRVLAWQNEQYGQDSHYKFSCTKITNLLSQWKKELINVILKYFNNH
ncbi:hypothetical protein [Histophilus somni]|uniref:Hemophilus-specific protein, possible transposase n=1 Tax=Histophilus somni (strain 129Pt) TaxID=205914 RepID=Q0I1S0_HISS1|nr:hypothetical protein [Histophilus somni]